jgi:hypothetical protein
MPALRLQRLSAGDVELGLCVFSMMAAVFDEMRCDLSRA